MRAERRIKTQNRDFTNQRWRIEALKKDTHGKRRGIFEK